MSPIEIMTIYTLLIFICSLVVQMVHKSEGLEFISRQGRNFFFGHNIPTVPGANLTSCNNIKVYKTFNMGMYIIHYSIEHIAFSAEYKLFNNCNFNLIYRYSLSLNLTPLQCNGYQMP